MRVLIVGIEEYGAVSKILLKTFNIINDKSIEFVCFGIGKKSETKINGITFIRNNPCSFFTRFTRKIYKLVNKDYYLLGWKSIYRQIKKIHKRFNPDVILAASGLFFYMKAAYELAKRNNKRLILMFFDPFKNNSLIKNKTSAVKEATKWCDYASNVLYDKDGDVPIDGLNNNKLIPFLIPIFECKNSTVSNKSIVYGGMFYNEFRKPDGLIKLINETKEDVLFDIYTESYFANMIREKTNNKANVHNLLGEREFEKVCENCLAIIVIGNGSERNTIPSKLLEAIGHKKPIIGLNFYSVPFYLKKYPFFFEYRSEKTIKEIKMIKDFELRQFDINTVFPERNPNYFLKLMLNAIKNICL